MRGVSTALLIRMVTKLVQKSYTNMLLSAGDCQRRKPTSEDILAVTVNATCKASVGVVLSDVCLGQEEITLCVSAQNMKSLEAI